MSLTLLDLFSGIGGFSLGLERAGFRTVAFCEIAPYPRQVLAKHWPGVPCYDDVRTVTQARLAADGLPRIDAVCGGFPCQEISLAGRGAGLGGKRSSLWTEYLRLIGEIRPRFAILENSPALRCRGLDQVLGALVAIGYDAEWHCLPAGLLGAGHRRDRIWIIAYPHREGLEVLLQGEARQLTAALGALPWASEPGVPRVAYGIPARVHRVQCLGNAIVPQIAEMIGRRIAMQEAA